ARRAFIAPAAGRAAMPSPFLLDDFLELRTFESFPGLRTVLRDLIAALGASGNRFVLTSRYASRALRLLRDAPAQFEIIPVAPLTAAEGRATPPGAPDDQHGSALPDGAQGAGGRPRARLARRGEAPAGGGQRAARDGRHHDAAGRRGPGERAGRAPRPGRQPRADLPLLLRAAAAPRARLRRAEGDPRGPGA